MGPISGSRTHEGQSEIPTRLSDEHTASETGCRPSSLYRSSGSTCTENWTLTELAMSCLLHSASSPYSPGPGQVRILPSSPGQLAAMATMRTALRASTRGTRAVQALSCPAAITAAGLWTLRSLAAGKACSRGNGPGLPYLFFPRRMLHGIRALQPTYTNTPRSYRLG